jgi:hypothetical protein
MSTSLQRFKRRRKNFNILLGLGGGGGGGIEREEDIEIRWVAGTTRNGKQQGRIMAKLISYCRSCLFDRTSD